MEPGKGPQREDNESQGQQRRRKHDQPDSAERLDHQIEDDFREPLIDHELLAGRYYCEGVRKWIGLWQRSMLHNPSAGSQQKACVRLSQGNPSNEGAPEDDGEQERS
jgi:hypothetical protein